jgi:hypothetical protein
MDKALRKTIYGLGILSLILMVIGLVLFQTMFTHHFFWFFPVLILLFFGIHSGFFILFYRSLKKSPNQFIRNFMVSTGVKFVIYFILILSYILSSPGTAIPFAISLSVLYVVYTAYDVLVMLSLIKHRKEISEMTDKLSN